jgi:hypothetical protein
MLLPATFTTVALMTVAIALAPPPSCAAWADGGGDRSINISTAALGATLLFSCSSANAPASLARPPQMTGALAQDAAAASPSAAPTPTPARLARLPQVTGLALAEDAAAASPSAAPTPTTARATGGAAQAQSAAAAFISLLAGAAAVAAL